MSSAAWARSDLGHPPSTHDGRVAVVRHATQKGPHDKVRGPMLLGAVNEKALRELAWPQLCAELATRARTPMGKERSFALLPGDDPDAARTRLARVEEARTLRRFEREQIRALHRSIKGRIEEMLEDEKIVPMLRDTYYSVRGDRYVLPLRAEHRAHLPGIVHNASNSGQTLFVEPQVLVELGNQLTIAEARALEEEQRILAELSGAVGRRAPLLEHDVEVIGLLDEAAAAGRLADDLDAGAPELGGERFDLRRARHPLLVLQRKSAGVVANDIALPAPAQALVVSGPNAGGKTVTITAVGLSALMARALLHIAAATGSRMPLYRTVHTAIGDEGDLSR